MTTILVVDDDPRIVRALRINLEARSYDVVEAESANGAIRMAADRNPDLVLLDLGLPDRDGLDVIAAIRGWSTMAIIVVTARHDETAKVDALDAGADDYLTKPFGINELLARIRANLRRAATGQPTVGTVTTEAFTIDFTLQAVQRTDGTAVQLTATEWSIVKVLVQHPGTLVTPRMMIDAVWGTTARPESSLVRVHLNHIRSKLEPEPGAPRYFVTDSRVGYRFVP